MAQESKGKTHSPTKKAIPRIGCRQNLEIAFNKRYHQPAIHVLIAEFTMGTFDCKTGAA